MYHKVAHNEPQFGEPSSHFSAAYIVTYVSGLHCKIEHVLLTIGNRGRLLISWHPVVIHVTRRFTCHQQVNTLLLQMIVMDHSGGWH